MRCRVCGEPAPAKGVLQIKTWIPRAGHIQCLVQMMVRQGQLFLWN